MRFDTLANVQFEQVEKRILFAWGATARLVNQDDAVSAYSSIDGSGVTVAVIDSGINYNHAALGGGFGAGKKVIAGHDFVDNDTDPMDEDGHGTEVAGVIAAEPFTYNGQEYSGIAPDANLVALRVTHGEDGAADGTIERALDWIIEHYQEFAIKVVNISLGSGSYTDERTNGTLSDEFAQLANLDILVVAASGNSGDSIFGGAGIAYPAADPNVLSVGSVNASDAISGFTQRGSNLDLLAPGDDVPTTGLSGYLAVDGTSFASPHVAGAAALLRQADPTLNAPDVQSALRASGLTNKDGDNETGRTSDLYYPRLDLKAALDLVNARKGSSRNVVGLGAGASDIAYDDQGVLHLVYYDRAEQSIAYATKNTDGLWSRTKIVDTSGANVGAYVSIAIDSTGKPGIAYFDETNADLKYAHFNGSSWDVRALDRNKSVGQFASLVYDQDGDPVVAYYRKSGGDLKLQTIDQSGNWTRIDIDTTGDVGQWANVAVTETAGVVAIAYNDATNGNLKYARYLDGQWTLMTVDDLSGGVAYVDLNIHNEQAFITYQDLTNGDLKFAVRADGLWHPETVYTPGNTGQFSSLVFDSNNTAHIVFFSKSKNLLYEAAGNRGSWNVRKLGSGGSWLSATTTGDEETISYVSLDSKKKNLQFGELA
jgi:subtilisin family serine protease